MRVNRLESGICDLPFLFVAGLGDVAYMHDELKVPFAPVVLDPLSLPEEARSLITNVRPMLLSLRYQPLNR